ncbi:hypothetical protein [Actinacidiphila bryophytorum]|uniref:Secreted protein n=1 Tax=Actinacidiphila bryophytorum TaxID=1436133 RepID=A0A9W4H397_9ACTN|nr:hypothetical protein [Actinacidiphila bryophytorum]MBM9437170.1 hypothetical protein [Actinacidiphila bryophytorum]MBN6542447.1 hypothetical protein [Actinacidiphila bryophytorum]CAG7646966.1 exported hypothetical protein [Actinacidiphila bryophytorum]
MDHITFLVALALLVTPPAAAGVGAPAAVAVAGIIVVLSRRDPVHADDVNNARTTSVRPVTAGAGA